MDVLWIWYRLCRFRWQMVIAWIGFRNTHPEFDHGYWFLKYGMWRWPHWKFSRKYRRLMFCHRRESGGYWVHSYKRKVSIVTDSHWKIRYEWFL